MKTHRNEDGPVQGGHPDQLAPDETTGYGTSSGCRRRTLVDLPWRRAETVDLPEPGAVYARVRVLCECGTAHHFRWDLSPEPMIRRLRCGRGRVYVVLDIALGDVHIPAHTTLAVA